LSGIYNDADKTFSLFCASKSQNEGPYATNFRKFLLQHLEANGIKEEEIAQDLYERKISLVFEVKNQEISKKFTGKGYYP
jgi:tRNA splicing ligase